MFGTIKKLFSKPEMPASPLARQVSSSKTYTPVRSFPSVPPQVDPVSTPEVSLEETLPAPMAESSPLMAADPPPSLESVSAPNCVIFPLHVILTRLPTTLTALAKGQPTDVVSIPLETIQRQLAHGAVRISFGDLRASTAPGVFQNNDSLDQVSVEIPLKEVLARIDPSLYARGPQKIIEVRNDQFCVFGDSRANAPLFEPQEAPSLPEPEKIAFRAYERPMPSAEPVEGPTPPSVNGSSQKQAEKVQFAFPVNGIPEPIAPSPNPVAPSPNPVAPPPNPVAGLTVNLSEMSESWPEAVKEEIQNLDLQNFPLTLPMDRLEPAMKMGRVAFAWGELLQWLNPPPPDYGSSQRDTVLELPLKIIAPLFLSQQRLRVQQTKFMVAENIPDLFRGLPSVPVALASPETLIVVAPLAPPSHPETLAPTTQPQEPKLQLRTEPAALPSEKTSPCELENELLAQAPIEPLPVADPQSDEACLADGQQSEEQAEGEILESALYHAQEVIAERQSEERLSSLPLIKMPASAPEPVVSEAKASDSSAKTEWAPREVVRKVFALNGVAGSLIAMNDGLLVATQLPEIYKPETISAFLPQIFGRMTSYSKDLQLGTLSCVTLTVNDTPCAIYKTGAFYFLVLGRAGENLPDAKLQRIATELGKRNL